MVDFAGWNMPVQYTSIMDEHNAVRNACGVFDISHMGQFIASGADVGSWLNSMFTNNTDKLGDHQGQYSLMLNPQGGVIDDLILYRLNEQSYFIVVNASKIDEDREWLLKHKPEHITLQDLSSKYAGMAVQGPLAAEVYAKALAGVELILPPRNGIATTQARGGKVWVCRTGYTGEDGFEFFCPNEDAAHWLNQFIEAGAKPCGLGARDSLRLEMCYPLNGSDLDPHHTPIQAGLGFFCDLSKDFIGAEVLREQKQNGTPERLVALQYLEKGAPPRAHYQIFADKEQGEAIGELCSAVLSPSLANGIGMAYLPSAYATLGTQLYIQVRGSRFKAEVVKKPFYKK